MATTILGISPGTRIMGIGVIRNGELIEWQVKTFKGKWSKKKLRIILASIDSLCEYFKVNGIALKKAYPFRSSNNLKLLMRQIISRAQKKQVKVSQYTINDLKRNPGTNGRYTKDDLMESLTEKYSMLRKDYLKERNNVRPYYLKMFEAISVARILDGEIEHI